MLSSCRLIFDDFKSNWQSLLGCEIFFKILGIALLGPVVAWIVLQLIALSGQAAISNVDIANFLMSPLGWLTLIAFIGLSSVVTFLSQGGLLLIQIGQLNDKPPVLSQTIITTLRRGPVLTQLALIFVVVFLIVASPFLIVGWFIYRGLLSEFDINYYLSEQPTEFRLAIVLAGILTVGLLIAWSFIYARTLFALPECMLGLQRPVASLKRSFQLTRQHTWKIFGCLILWFILTSLVSGLIWFAVQMIELVGLRVAGDSFEVVAIMIGLLLTLNFLGGILSTTFGSVSQSLMIGRLYWTRLQQQAPVANAEIGKQWQALPGIAKPRPALDSAASKSMSAWMTTRRAVLIVVFLLVIASTVSSLFLLSKVKFEDDVRVTAHRGSSKEAPENTLSAIRLAIADGADYAEIDVQETADGVVIVMHDADFMRIAGVQQNIWDTAYEDLRKIDAGRWFHESFAGEPVPSLQEIIDVAKGNIKLNIELKFNGHDKKLVVRTLDVVKQNGFESQSVVSSLDHQSLEQVKSIDATIKVGAIVGASIGELSKLNTDFIAVNVGQVDRAMVRGLHRQGKEIHVWTVNDIETMSDMIDLGADNIMTDEPKKLIRVLEERRHLSDAERLLLAFRKLIEY